MTGSDQLIKTILHQNRSSITKSLENSFSSTGIPISTIHFTISIDIIELYDISIDAANILCDLNQIEKSLKDSLGSIVSDFFKRKEYIHIPFLSQIFSVDFDIKPAFCLSDRFNCVFPEITEYTQTGYSTGKITKRFMKPIKVCSGLLSFMKKDIIQHNQTFACTNISCSNKTVCIYQNSILFLINPEEKTITKIIEVKKCFKCGSILSKVYSSIKYEYIYVLSIINEDENIKDRFITIKSHLDLSEMIKNGDTLINQEIYTLHGCIERDWKGMRNLRLLSCTFKTEINKSIVEIKKKILRTREEKRSTIEKLKDFSKDVLFFKKKVVQTDIILMLIANIFNCQNTDYYCDVFDDMNTDSVKNNKEVKSINNLMSSPDSNQISILERDAEDTKSRRILIITNDVYYVSRVFRAILEIPVFFTIKDKRCQKMLEFICIIDQIPKVKDKIDSLFDLQFKIEIDTSCILDYSYLKVNSTRLPKMAITLNEQEKKNLAEVFAKQRRLFKGLLKPYRLLRTTEELYLSIKYFTGGLKNFNVLEDFNKWIFY